MRLLIKIAVLLFSVEEDDEEDELGTEYLIKSREQNRAVKEEIDSQADEAEIGTEFLIKNEVNLSPKELSVPLRSSRRRSAVTINNTSAVSVDENSQGEESGPSRQLTDIAADAMSLQPTGYTLETAHVSNVIMFILLLVEFYMCFFVLNRKFSFEGN